MDILKYVTSTKLEANKDKSEKAFSGKNISLSKVSFSLDESKQISIEDLEKKIDSLIIEKILS